MYVKFILGEQEINEAISEFLERKYNIKGSELGFQIKSDDDGVYVEAEYDTCDEED